MMRLPLVLAGLLGFAMTACGSSFPPPNEKMATTTASVRAASEVGGQNEPQAALHLKLAQEQLDQAKRMMTAEENQRAEYVLLRADSDAELAVALARQAQARAQAKQAQDEVKALKAEAGHK